MRRWLWPSYLLLAALMLHHQWPAGYIVGIDDCGAIIYPHLLMLGQWLRQGQIPLWNPYEWCGQTFAGHQNSPLFYPPNYLCAWISADRYLLWSLIGHVALGAYGMAWLLPRWGLARAAPWLAAAYALSAPFYAELERPPMVAVAGLTPWFFYCGERFRGQPRAVRWLLGCSAILSLQILAGFHQSVQIEAALVFAIGLGPWRSRRMWGAMLGVAAAALAMSAVQLLPFLEHVQASSRSLASSAYYHAYSMRWEYLPATFAAAFCALSRNSLHFTPYAIPLAWSVLALASGKPRSALARSAWLLVALGLLLSLSDGTPWEGLLNRIVPTYASCRYRVRFLHLTLMGVLWLAGAGFERLLEAGKGKLAWALVGLGLGEALLLALPYNPAVAPTRAISREAFAGIPSTQRYLPQAHLYRHYWNWGAVEQIGSLGGYGSLSTLRYEELLQFVESSQLADPQNLLATLNNNGIRPHLSGTHPIVRLLCAGVELSSERSGSPVVRRELPHPCQRFALCWKVTHCSEPLQRLQRLCAADFDGDQEVVVEEPLASSLGQPRQSRVELVEFTPNRIVLEVETDQRVLLRLSEVWNAGWESRVDGHLTPTLRVDHCLRGVVIEPGRHRVVQLYRPRSLQLGFAISAITWLVWLGALVALGRGAQPESRSPLLQRTFQ